MQTENKMFFLFVVIISDKTFSSRIRFYYLLSNTLLMAHRSMFLIADINQITKYIDK